jgi:cyclohexa-1,5-dienecarbonyl-CoA hydratase
MSEGILVARRGRVATLTLDRPPLNILDLPALEALDRAIAALAAGDDLQLVFLRGAGPRSFSTGVAVQDHTRDKIGAAIAALHGAIRGLRTLPALTVAAVHGHCLGGGMELALGCDMVLATNEAQFGQPEIQLGCFPPAAAAILPGLVGPARALELLATGRTFDVAEAERLGLVTWRAGADLDGGIARVEAELTSKSAAVTRLLKRAVLAGGGRAWEAALAESERIYLEELMATEDVDEGVAAFLEKRPPTWRHR